MTAGLEITTENALSPILVLLLLCCPTVLDMLSSVSSHGSNGCLMSLSSSDGYILLIDTPRLL